jgi:capsular polysaccharide biosynthesis protein
MTLETKHFEIVKHNSFVLTHVNANFQLVFWKRLTILNESKLNLIDVAFYRKPLNFIRFLLINYLKRRKKRVNQTSIWVLDIWSSNYYHWMVEALPKILSCKLKLEDVTIVLPVGYRKFKFHEETLRLLNVGVEYFDEEKERLYFKKVFVPLNVALGGTANKLFIDELRKKLIAPMQSQRQGGRKVYCSRKFADKRKIVNEEAVTSMLMNEGFEIVAWENMTFNEQIQLAAQTNFLVGLHGAGLTNMIFMNPGGIVLELIRMPENNPCYHFLAHAAELRHYTLQCRSLSEDIHNADCEVNVDNLRRMINGIMNDATRSYHKVTADATDQSYQ